MAGLIAPTGSGGESVPRGLERGVRDVCFTLCLTVSPEEADKQRLRAVERFTLGYTAWPGLGPAGV